MAYPYNVIGIVWVGVRPDLPEKATVWLPDCLVLSGPEDFEIENEDDDNELEKDDLDDDECDDDEELSDEAWEAWDAAWVEEIKNLLEAQYGDKVLSIGGFEPTKG